MTRTFIFLGIGTLWAFLMAELVKRELLPYYEYQSPPTYRTQLQREQPVLERWTIKGGPEVIGQSETLFEPLVDGARIRTHTSYDLKSLMPAEAQLLPGSFRVEAWSDVSVDYTFQLTTMETRLRNQFGAGRVLGHRQGPKLLMSYEFRILLASMNPIRGGQSVDLPKDATLSDVVMPFHDVGRLRLNKKWKFHALELGPQGLQVEPMYALVEARELRMVKGQGVEVFRIDVKKRPTEDTTCVAQAWVDDEGQVIEQRSYQGGTTSLQSFLEEKRMMTPQEAARWPWTPPEDP